MMAPDDSFIIELKEKTKLVKRISTFLILVFIFLGILYFLFWVVIMTDKTFASGGEKLFGPIAHFFYPDETELIIYRKTSFALFLLIFPCFFVHYLMDKFEEKAIEKYALMVEKKRLAELKKEKEIKLRSYDDINEFSICFSIEFSNELRKEKAQELSNYIYTKIKEAFSNKITGVYPSLDKYLIIRSNHFEKFDYVFEALMKVLSKIDALIEKKYDIDYTPSITIDGFTSGKDNKIIQQQHFEIGTFNFKNRAISTMLFSKKYTFLQYSKYKGIPIGEYAYFDNANHNNYELNVVFKNLSNSIKQFK